MATKTELTGTALVTGSSRGLGKVIAARLAAAGCAVVVTARGEVELAATADELRDAGATVTAIPADLTDEVQRVRLIDEIAERAGGVDILVNNAGSGTPARFAHTDLGDIRHLIELDLVAPIHLTQLVLPAMVDRGRGHVVNISSMLAKMPFPLVTLYGSAKAGLDYFSASLAAELEGSGVGVSYVSPGGISDDGLMVSLSETTGVELSSMARRTMVTTDRVASDVLKAIRKQKVETLATSGGRMIKNHPKLGAAMMRRIGMYAFMDRVAEETRKDDTDAGRAVADAV